MCASVLGGGGARLIHLINESLPMSPTIRVEARDGVSVKMVKIRILLKTNTKKGFLEILAN